MAALALGMVLAACGDDDEDAGGSPATTAASGSDETTTTAGGAGGEHAELCALAQEMFDQEDFPTADQVRQYQELAPEEIADAVAVAAPVVIENEDDPAAMLAAFADDEVEAAIAEIDQFEDENCGTTHENPGVAPEEPEAGAAVVEVVASDYTFALPESIAAGRTSFVMTNDGQEAHFLALARIVEGHTMQEALEFEGDPEEAGMIEEVEGGETGLAAPGGEDAEVATVDLAPGTYAAVCFIPGPDGTPHAFMGMAVEFTVS